MDILAYIKTFFEEFIHLCNEMSPYLLLGFIFAGILHVYINKEKTIKYLGKKNLRSVVNASLIGIPLPLCSCGVIPTGISFSKNGATKGASVSFLISTPQTGIDSILVTYSMLGLPFALVRPIVAFFSGIFGGAVMNATDKFDYSHIQPEFRDEKKFKSKFRNFFHYAFVEFLQDISKWLIIGLVLAAVIAVILPENFFTTYINNPLLNMLIVLAASIPLYVCATGSVPIAAVLIMKGLSPGAALVFLMAGPATNAATMTVIGNALGRRTLIMYLTSIIGAAIFFGLLIDYLFPAGFFISTMTAAGHTHTHILPEYVKYISSILLGLLIIHAFIRKRFPGKTIQKNNTMENITIKIGGMNCNHCKTSVEMNLKLIENIESIQANIEAESVHISGDKVDLKQVEEIVNKLGFEYQGVLN